MRVVRYAWVGGAFLAGMLIAMSPAWAGQNAECKQDAKDEYMDCKTLCKEVYRSEKDLCRNIDHACAEACRAIRNACLDALFAERDLCMAPCSLALQDAKASCRALYEGGSEELDQCIDAAQIVAFICRDECREGYRGDLRACRAANRACIADCPPAVVE